MNITRIYLQQRNFHTYFFFVLRLTALFIIIYALHPYRFSPHYEHLDFNAISTSNIYIEHVTSNISLQQLPACTYDDLIQDNTYAYKKHYLQNILNIEEIKLGGEYTPPECRPLFSTAIIIPYRQREEQLHTFLIYMHNFLRQQRIHYRIFLVEQYDHKPFNRAKLFNIGSVIAAENGFHCLILHDVDLLPFRLGQLYACTRQPRHMCPALDKFRFNLLYDGLFGGAVAVQMNQFLHVNGMSNVYEGWGAEDDDFRARLIEHNYTIVRFPPDYSEYTMMRHKPEKPNEQRLKLLIDRKTRFLTDGLNSLVYNEKERRLHSLFTHILVEI